LAGETRSRGGSLICSTLAVPSAPRLRGWRGVDKRLGGQGLEPTQIMRDYLAGQYIQRTALDDIIPDNAARAGADASPSGGSSKGLKTFGLRCFAEVWFKNALIR
jgi:hypothetical protein